MARRKEAHGGGHGWFVTFADLMGLLVSFFVMLVAFSNQDAKKVQAVAGSMRDAFGVQPIAQYSGVVESDFSVVRPYIKNAAHIQPQDSSLTPTPDEKGTDGARDKKFMLAVASLRRALDSLPDLAEASKHIMLEETKLGLNINIVDQQGSPMFAEGSVEPYESARKLFQEIAGPLRDLPYRVAITGHTSASHDPTAWTLSAGRANVVRKIFEEQGFIPENIYKVAGKGATDPLWADDPSLAANRRVTITLLREAPPVPVDLKP